MRNKSKIISWMNSQHGEIILLQSPPLFPCSHQRVKKNLPPKTSLLNQRKKLTRWKQTTISISHLQYPLDAQKPPRDISSTQDAHSPGVTVVWYHHMPLFLQQTDFCASPHLSDKDTYCGTRLLPECAINTLQLLLTQLRNSKSVASKIRK